jgi:hypothetical protein
MASLPLMQAAKIGAYVMKKHITGQTKYPLVLMLEPLFRCNLACSGCGKIDYPDDILNQRLSVQQCMDAIDECGAPAVSIAGGEPLLHRDMPKIVEGYIERGKFVILCTHALLGFAALQWAVAWRALPCKSSSSISKWMTRPTPALSISAAGCGVPLPHLHRDWAHPCHVCAGSGLTPATSAPGLGSPLPRLHRD